MNQRTDWPTPAVAAPADFKPRRPLTIGHKIFIGIAILAVFGAIASAADKQDGSGGGNPIVVKAGWDATHVANLSVKITDDDGFNSMRADCAAEGIAGAMTFLTWESLSAGDQYAAIKLAESAC